MCGVSQVYDAFMRGEQPQFTFQLYALCRGVSFEFDSYPFLKLLLPGSAFISGVAPVFGCNMKHWLFVTGCLFSSVPVSILR